MQAVMRDRTGAKLALTPDSNYSTPLHIAASKGHLASLRVLLENSQNLTKLDSINELGRTALHLAASNGHAQYVVIEIGLCVVLWCSVRFLCCVCGKSTNAFCIWKRCS